MHKQWQKYYIPAQKQNWQGRTDSQAQERFFQIVDCCDLREGFPQQTLEKTYALLGFCCDEGVRRNLGRVGAAQGPQALRQALAKLALPLTEEFVLFDIGDIVCQNENLEAAQTALATLVSQLLQKKIMPIILGGGHEVAWGHYQGIALHNPNIDLGIINFDAHFDLRPLHQNDQGHSGSPFLQIAQARQAKSLKFDYMCLGIQKFSNTQSLFAAAKSLNTTYIAAEDLNTNPAANYFSVLDNFMAQHQSIYLTLCLDVFAAAFAPGVSAPQALGLLPHKVLPLLRHIFKSNKVISFDIAELAPQYDRENMTAQLAANLLAVLFKK
jgi:formiminoglutamase